MPKIIHFKKECIGCGACAAIAPEYFEIDNEGLAQLKNSKQEEDGKWVLEVKDKELAQEAANSCPVNIIHVCDK